jgi:hypothetical protein
VADLESSTAGLWSDLASTSNKERTPAIRDKGEFGWEFSTATRVEFVRMATFSIGTTEAGFLFSGS